MTTTSPEPAVRSVRETRRRRWFIILAAVVAAGVATSAVWVAVAGWHKQALVPVLVAFSIAISMEMVAAIRPGSRLYEWAGVIQADEREAYEHGVADSLTLAIVFALTIASSLVLDRQHWWWPPLAGAGILLLRSLVRYLVRCTNLPS